MDIKRVDNREMTIHTKEKAKIKTHKKPVTERVDFISRMKQRMDDGDVSVKIKNSSLHIKESELAMAASRLRIRNHTGINAKGEKFKDNLKSGASGLAAAGADRMADEVEGGGELRDAVATAGIVAEPLMYAGEVTVSNTFKVGEYATRKALEEAKRRIKMVDAKKKLAKENAKNRTKNTIKYASRKVTEGAAKETAKEIAKETAKVVAETSAEVAAETAVTVGTEVGATAAGSSGGPYGALIGYAAGKKAGDDIAKKIERNDARRFIRLRKIRWFIDKTRAEEDQKDSLVKIIRDVILRDLIAKVRLHKSLILMAGGLLVFGIIALALPVVAVLAVIYNSPLAIFFPSPDDTYEDPRTVLASYYSEFNQNLTTMRESGTEITYQNTENGVPVANYNDTLMVYMTLYCDSDNGCVMNDKGKDDLKKIFDEMNYTDEDTTTEEKQCGDSIGELWITAYCPCSICCGQYANGITASGNPATPNHTIAVDAYHPIVPMGTKVIIDGKEYTVEDTGDLNAHGNDIDMYFVQHSEALQWGRQHLEVFLADGNSNTVEVTITGTTVHNLTYEDYIAKGTLNSDQEEMLKNMMDKETWDAYYEDAPGQAVATLAMSKVGCAYSQDKRYDEGYYDCSSLVYRLYKEVGINLPTLADTQAEYCYNNALMVNKDDLIPGDLIFYSYEQTGSDFMDITHVAIYVGDGKMVHAANEEKGVILQKLSESDVVFYARPYR